MSRLLIPVVFVVFVSAACQSCLAQTNITSICLLGWDTASISNGSPVTLTWAYETSNVEGIGIERSTSVAGPWTLIGVVAPTVTNYTDQTVLCAMSYWYRVYAFNAAGNSGYSNTAGPSAEGPCP
jgi:hypothetical protein